jgi:hypothetical protein
MNTQENEEEPQSIIVIRLPRWRKGQYIGASRLEGKTLVGWVLEQCDKGLADSGWSPPNKPRDEGETSGGGLGSY